jgi:hypothetical protein
MKKMNNAILCCSFNSKIDSVIKFKGKINDEEYKIIVAMTYDKFDKPIQFDGVGNIVKKIIWKFTMGEMEN